MTMVLRCAGDMQSMDEFLLEEILARHLEEQLAELRKADNKACSIAYI